MIRTVLLAISLLGFFLSAKQLLEYWDYQSVPVNVSKLLHQEVTPENLNTLIGTAINEDQLEDAKMYLAIGQSYDYPLHYDYYEQHIEQRDTQLRKIKKGINNFSSGFISGKGSDTSGVSGALVSDFTVVGDARDLYEQYQAHSNGEEVNQLIVGLAGVGIGLTVVTYGSGGTTAVAKSGTSVIKLAAKTGRLTRRFSDELLRLSSRVFDWSLFKQSFKQSDNFSDVRRAVQKSFNRAAAKPLQGMAKQVNNIRKNSSLVDTLDMMRYVETADDLRRLNKFTSKHQSLSKGILRLLGKGALGSVRILRKTTGFFLSLAGTVFSFIFSILFLFSYGKKKPR